MFYDPTTLASITSLLAETLRRDYRIDPEPLYRAAGIPIGPQESPQSRYPLKDILGFSDQSNFARAFKWWTSMSPKQYREAAGNC